METEVGVMRFEDEERGTNQKMQVASRSQERQENRFSRRKKIPADTLTLAKIHCGFQKLNIVNLYCFKPLCLLQWRWETNTLSKKF